MAKQEDISPSFKVQWLNTTLKFLKNDNQLIYEYPEMHISQVEYLYNLILQRKNDLGMGFKAMCAPIWEAMKIFGLKYEFKVSILKSEDKIYGQLVIEKIPKSQEKRLELEDEDILMSDDSQSSPENTMSNNKTKKSKTPKGRKYTKAEKYFIEMRKIIDSISPSFLRTTLQSILEFVEEESRCSIEFKELAPIEAKFLDNLLGILKRSVLFEELFSPACVEIFGKINAILKNFDNKYKLEICGSTTDPKSKKRELMILKVPKYTKSSSGSDIRRDAVPKLRRPIDYAAPSLLPSHTRLFKAISPQNISPVHDTATGKVFFANEIVKAENNNLTIDKENTMKARSLQSMDEPETQKETEVPHLYNFEKKLFKLPRVSSSKTKKGKTKDTKTKDKSADKSKDNSEIKLETKPAVSEDPKRLESKVLPNKTIKDNFTEKVNAKDKIKSKSGNNEELKNVNNTKTKLESKVLPNKKIKDNPTEEFKNDNNLKTKKSICPISFAKAGTLSRENTGNSYYPIDNTAQKTMKTNQGNKKMIKAMSVPLESDKGMRMMRLMGWEGGALGVRGEGLVEPIMPSLHITPGAGFGHVTQEKQKKEKKEKKSRETSVEENRVKQEKKKETNLQEKKRSICHIVQNKKNEESKEIRLQIFMGILDMIDNAISVVKSKTPLSKKEERFVEVVANGFNNRRQLVVASDTENDLASMISSKMAAEPELMIVYRLSSCCKEVTITKSYTQVPKTKKQKHNTNNAVEGEDILTMRQAKEYILSVEGKKNVSKLEKLLYFKLLLLTSILEFLDSNQKRQHVATLFVVKKKAKVYAKEIFDNVNITSLSTIEKTIVEDIHMKCTQGMYLRIVLYAKRVRGFTLIKLSENERITGLYIECITSKEKVDVSNSISDEVDSEIDDENKTQKKNENLTNINNNKIHKKMDEHCDSIDQKVELSQCYNDSLSLKTPDVDNKDFLKTKLISDNLSKKTNFKEEQFEKNNKHNVIYSNEVKHNKQLPCDIVIKNNKNEDATNVHNKTIGNSEDLRQVDSISIINKCIANNDAIDGNIEETKENERLDDNFKTGDANVGKESFTTSNKSCRTYDVWSIIDDQSLEINNMNEYCVVSTKSSESDPVKSAADIGIKEMLTIKNQFCDSNEVLHDTMADSVFYDNNLDKTKYKEKGATVTNKNYINQSSKNVDEEIKGGEVGNTEIKLNIYNTAAELGSKNKFNNVTETLVIGTDSFNTEVKEDLKYSLKYSTEETIIRSESINREKTLYYPTALIIKADDSNIETERSFKNNLNDPIEESIMKGDKTDIVSELKDNAFEEIGNKINKEDNSNIATENSKLHFENCLKDSLEDSVVEKDKFNTYFKLCGSEKVLDNYDNDRKSISLLHKNKIGELMVVDSEIKIIEYENVNIIKIVPSHFPRDKIDFALARKVQQSISIREEIKDCYLKCHGIQNGGIIYSCNKEVECVKRVLSETFKHIDYTVERIDKCKINVKINSFFDLKDTLQKMDEFNQGLNIQDWVIVVYSSTTSGLSFVVEISVDSLRLLCENNFSLFAGIDIANVNIIL